VFINYNLPLGSKVIHARPWLDSCQHSDAELARGLTRVSVRWIAWFGLLFVDISPVANLDNFNDEHIINNFIDHSIISDPNSVGTLATTQLGASMWKRINYKSFNSRNDPLDIAGGNASKILASGLAPFNLVRGHRLEVARGNRYEQSWALCDDLRYQQGLESPP